MFCKAFGGLNDALVQLWYCTGYAKSRRRAIILRFVEYSADLTKVFDFSRYPVPITTDLSILDKMQIEPESYRTQLHDKPYIHAHPCSPVNYCRLDLNTKCPVGTIPVHASAGGGAGYKTLEHLSFTPELLKKFNELYADMPSVYSCIHIRNTDMVTTLDKHVDTIKAFIKTEPVYICSDNAETIEWAKAFGLLPTKTRHYGSEPLHSSIYERDDHVLYDAIYDLILLANSKRLLILQPDNGPSGFGNLAKDLHRNKALLNKLLKRVRRKIGAAAKGTPWHK